MKQNTYIIAEAGVNHNGSIDTAFEMIDVAVGAGADAIKFQSFNSKLLVTENAQQADYQKKNNKTQSQLEMLQALELNEEEQKQLYQYCQKSGIDFLSSPFDMKSCRFLIEELGLTTIKTGSGELGNAQMLYYIAQNDCNIILSTGLSTIKDIENALSILAYGYQFKQPPGSSKDYINYYKNKDAYNALKEHVTILHCTTEYPCPYGDVNLNVLKTLSDKFKLPCGYSDHTHGIHISLAAATLGAPVIEKHFTLNRNQTGPDHQASIEPHELNLMVTQIREIEKAMGGHIKAPTASELNNKSIVQKGLYAAREIKPGEPFTVNNIIAKRPLTQTDASKFWDIVGQCAEKHYFPGMPL